jgi:hypothetical protein
MLIAFRSRREFYRKQTERPQIGDDGHASLLL